MKIEATRYPLLAKYTSPVRFAQRPIIGRDREMNSILSAFERPELCNVILLGDPGVGKSAVVQGLAKKDFARSYLEVDLARMVSDLKNPDELAGQLKKIFAETTEYVSELQLQDATVVQKQLVLFIDEFHLVTQLSKAAVEALKPLLADSGTRNIRVIGATTYEEFRTYISSNLPLVERLQRINMLQTDKETTISILRDMAIKYNVASSFYTDHVFEMIYEYTNRYIPASSQPRKSILVLDAMIGYHRHSGKPLDVKLLADVIYESENVNVAVRVDAMSIKNKLNQRVLAQPLAMKAIEERLQICTADLNSPDKPMASMLFSGSTGSGKSIADHVRVPVWSEDGGVGFKDHGDLVPGDYVFNKQGEPVKILRVFPQGLRRGYEVIFKDGRMIPCDADHLWKVKCGEIWEVLDTKTILYRMEYLGDRFMIPMNEAVLYPHRDYLIDPYLAAVLYAGYELDVSNKDQVNIGDHVSNKVCRIIGNSFKTSDQFNWIKELNMIKDEIVSIIDEYKVGSAMQRFEFIQGLFDVCAKIDTACNGKILFYHEFYDLIQNVQDFLFSLGIASDCDMVNDAGLYELKVYAGVYKRHLFSDPYRLKDFEGTGESEHISEVEIDAIIETQHMWSMQCIEVDDPDHLYQVGQYIVTHNTETAKALADILFQDEKNLIRFDMSEYAREESMGRFQKELTRRIWERPYSILLLDEIEKACGSVTRLLLQVLDDGRLSDENGREVSFTNTYIIMTTNAGSEVYKTIGHYAKDSDDTGRVLKDYLPVIRNSITKTAGDNKFPPELLGRINCLVPFQPLSLDTQREIVVRKIKKLKEEVLVKHGVILEVDKKVLVYLVDNHMSEESDAGGARAAVSRFEEDLVALVARKINESSDKRRLRVAVDGVMRVEDKGVLEDSARLVAQVM